MITHRPKVGELLLCNFGQFAQDQNNFDGKIPPEMIKNRLVVVLNGDLSGGGCLVVPISSTRSADQRFHVEIDSKLIAQTKFFDHRQRWAKTETVQAVSKVRLFYIFDNGKRLDQRLPFDVVKEIQTSLIKAIGGMSLLQK